MLLNRNTPKPPKWESIKAIIGHSCSLGAAMLAVADYCNSKPTPKAFRLALKERGYASPELALKDLSLIEPLFTAAVGDLKAFRTQLERMAANA